MPDKVPADAAAARAELDKAVSDAVRLIADSTAQAATGAFGGLKGLAAAPVEQAAEVVAGNAPLRVGEGLSVLLTKASTLVLRAVDKIVAAPGPAARPELGWVVTDWVGELRRGTPALALVEHTYEPGQPGRVEDVGAVLGRALEG